MNELDPLQVLTSRTNEECLKGVTLELLNLMYLHFPQPGGLPLPETLVTIAEEWAKEFQEHEVVWTNLPLIYGKWRSKLRNTSAQMQGGARSRGSLNRLPCLDDMLREWDILKQEQKREDEQKRIRAGYQQEEDRLKRIQHEAIPQDSAKAQILARAESSQRAHNYSLSRDEALTQARALVAAEGKTNNTDQSHNEKGVAHE